MSEPPTRQSKDDEVTLDKAIDLYKFYQGAAEGTKGHAWSQTTWILTLNAGILAFSAGLYAQRRELPKLPLEGFLIIEWISAVAGAVLCFMLFVVLGELGAHIRNDWKGANVVRCKYPALKELIYVPPETLGRKEKESDRLPGFCRRLRRFAVAFILADLAWALVVTGLALREPG